MQLLRPCNTRNAQVSSEEGLRETGRRPTTRSSPLADNSQLPRSRFNCLIECALKHRLPSALSVNQGRPNTACTRLVGVCAFSSRLHSLELIPLKWRCLVPPTSG